MLKFKKLSSQIEIYDDVTCIYKDTFANFLKDFVDDAKINFNYDFILCDPESLHLILNNGGDVETRAPGFEWSFLFSNIQDVLTNKNNRDTNINISEEVKNALLQIDHAAGVVRSKVITVSPGQESTYLIKGTQAHAFKDAGYSGTVPPMVMAEINATGQSPQVTTDSILEQEAQWIGIASIIEEIRRYSKVRIGNARNIQAVRTELAAALTRFANLGQ